MSRTTLAANAPSPRGTRAAVQAVRPGRRRATCMMLVKDVAVQASTPATPPDFLGLEDVRGPGTGPARGPRDGGVDERR